ncbi:anti-sigma factor family protein [Candidatus Blastococcus massiliensis]|uniref:anti-sigma factor family protein n=1 Tax=Candidatus Blastococcus massiliensis TaxID=1470358 RepID=UPI0004B5DC8A|nr:anti-sigma factor [Candidatus Blastococcus massiliensis]
MSISESHLAQEAIAALVDGELTAGPAARAARHLEGCLQCRMAVQAQREAKDALHGCHEVSVPGDLMSRLCAIPFTADVPGSGGGPLSLGGDPGKPTVRNAAAAWEVDLSPQDRPQRADQARWLRRGLACTLTGLGVGVTALALNLPSAAPAGPGPAAGFADSAVREHTQVVPPVVRVLDVGTSSSLPEPGGTP